VLPNSQDAPAASAQGARDQLIPNLVGRKLPSSKRHVVAPLGRVRWATVLEATIDKDGGAEQRKDKIRFPEDRLPPPPACDVMQTEKFNQGQFGIFVSTPANPRHHGRALRLGEYVRHSNSTCCRRQQLNQAAERDYP